MDLTHPSQKLALLVPAFGLWIRHNVRNVNLHEVHFLGHD